MFRGNLLCFNLLPQGHIAGSSSTWCPPGPPGPFLQSFFPPWPAAQPILVHGFISPQVQDFSLLDFMRLLAVYFHSLLRFVWMAARPSGVSATPPSLVSGANVLRAHSAPSSRSFMKMLNRIGPCTEPYGTLLVTGLQVFRDQSWHQLLTHTTEWPESPSAVPVPFYRQ